MYLLPVDMAKLGWLYLQHGAWDDRQLVSRRWVEASLEPHVEMPASGGAAGYGYYWWVYPERGLCEAWGGQGQRIGLLPALDVVIVVTADIADDQSRSRFAESLYEYICRAATSADPLPANPAAIECLERLVHLNVAADT